jgi:dienelactone hydrolase
MPLSSSNLPSPISHLRRASALLLPIFGALAPLLAADFPEPTPDTLGNRMLQGYLERKVATIEKAGSLAPFTTAEQWTTQKAEARLQLFDMLGLHPLPERTPLKPTITGTLDATDVLVERLHFQSRPGLYVTANFYKPKTPSEKPLPTILYLCGHGVMKEKGISFGNKTAYHHHGLWFARNGYTCLTIDTLQLGEIEGEHHGTHHLGKWWWLSRGYTPAGVEAWNSIRALDYLETRPEVDPKRLGVTGRSGGGAYSWWIAALDDRIACAAPTAGITDLRNHLVDGCIEGHCDCMFQVNTHRWDYDRLAALVAPRPLLICNTDDDRIFPLDGVVRLYQSTRRLYKLLGKEDQIGLHIAQGPHKDTQPLHIGAQHWFNRHLQSADLMHTTSMPATKTLTPADLRVFGKDLPPDQLNTTIDHTFVPAAPAPEVPADRAAWDKQTATWMHALQTQVFAAWPTDLPAPDLQKVSSMERDGVRMTTFDFESDAPFRLRLHLTHRAGLRPQDLTLAVLNVLDQPGWDQFCNTYHTRFGKLIESYPLVKKDDTAFESEQKMFAANPWAMIYFSPRGIGPTAWEGSEKAQTHRLRRFPLIGETLHSTQTWDIRRALQSIRQIAGFETTRLWATAERTQAVNTLLASLFEDEGQLDRLDLHHLPPTLTTSEAHYLNILKTLDLPAAVALAATRTKTILYTTEDQTPWTYPQSTLKTLALEKNLQLRQLPPPEK